MDWFEQLEESGEDTSGITGDRPELFEYLVPYWNAFHVMSKSRSVGMGLGAIPLEAYESYFRIFGIDGLSERLEYITYVGALDSAYLEFQNQESKRKSDAKGKGAKAPRSSTQTKRAIPPRKR